MVQRESVLEPVGGDVPRVPEPADVVDQDVDTVQAFEHLPGNPPHLGLGGQVRHDCGNRTATGDRADLAGGVLSAPPGPGR